MTEVANIILLFAGLIPVIVSAIKVEKYYTSFHTGLWNMYGTILTILGFITSENTDYSLIVFGIIIIIFIGFLILLTFIADYADIIRFIGKSSITASSTIFFILLYCTQNWCLSLSFGISTIIAVYLGFNYYFVKKSNIYKGDSHYKYSFQYAKDKRKAEKNLKSMFILSSIYGIFHILLNLGLIALFPNTFLYPILIFILFIFFTVYFIGYAFLFHERSKKISKYYGSPYSNW